MDSMVTWLTENGFTLETAIVLAAIFFAWWNLSSRFGQLLQACNNFYSNTKTFLGVVADRLKLKSDFRALFASNFLDSNVVSNSPISLSRRGVQVGKRLDATQTVQDNLSGVLKIIPKEATAYDVQKVCFDYALNEFSEGIRGELRKKIHKEAYRDGGNMNNVLMVYAVLFRDAVFEELSIDAE